MNTMRLTYLCRFVGVVIIVTSVLPGLTISEPERANGRSKGRRGDGRIRGPTVTQRQHQCEQRSCYPATGNLLIGREDRLFATSTCGLHGQERYCIVSHLEDRKKCFWCDSTPVYADDPRRSHLIKNIVYRYRPGNGRKTWWQSENGVENVTIQLDMEAEFHFTHLIITFKTFRPAAMLIERSYDFGNTWQVYRYFAYNCEETFPGIPKGPPRSLTEIVCESRYSNVAPSSRGEVIFRVLPPNLRIVDPYSQEVQNLLKMTNLRINFTKLHTLGDDLLDNRQEIREKYYYSIYDVTVRGSCSCYGHASRCLPLPGVQPFPDMVHGRCECTHNTKGLNCEQCMDFYNDLPWRPAFGKQTNQCRKCTCNNHAISCHFDPAVYEATGKLSGGVCDNCQHNTIGRSCEQCKDFFFQDPNRDITDPEICQPCDCDPRGSLDEGICDSRSDPVNGFQAGQCHCKKNVDGQRCDRCKNGFWKFDENNTEGCQSCTCNILGTIYNQGCNVYTGECTCKRYVTGRDCSQCSPEYWGLSEDHEGCKPCDCDPGGTYDNNCDVVNGKCRCRPYVTGRTCNQAEQGYFAGLMDYFVYEAELGRGSETCQVIVREPYRDGIETSWSGVGFMRVFENSYLEFEVDNIITSMEYDIVIRYEPQFPGRWEEVQVTVERPGPVDSSGICANTIPQDDLKQVSLPSDTRHVVVAHPACLEAGNRYKIRLDFRTYDSQHDTPTASVLIDSIVLIPRIESIPFFSGSAADQYRREEFEHFWCGQGFYMVVKPAIPDVCKKYLYSIGFYVNDGAYECDCDRTGSTSTICNPLGGQCQCKSYVVGRRCDRCAPGTYRFGPEGCTPCECNSIGSLDNFCDAQTGQCKCRPNTYGRMCDQCQPGFWDFPNCRRCECNGHADSCKSRTGYCEDCRDFTAGPNCDRCLESYYGDPRLQTDIPCRPCPCPDTIESGHSYASHCVLDSRTKNVMCECKEGYAGPHCDVCADNYFGNPEVPGGSCRTCNCSNNIDISRPGNCDGQTGACLQCLFSTEGFNCEICKSGYYGDARHQLCMMCVCNLLGTDPNSVEPCNRNTGQCPCLPNVTGKECDSCVENHWKLASGKGCEPCDCDSIGSDSKQCNSYDGQCKCNPGFGGRRCNECQANYWGNPKEDDCKPCDCDPEGTATAQCDRDTGYCVCQEGIGGYRCEQCAYGYKGYAPYCESCGECFNNWDRILIELKEHTLNLIEEASQIKQTGATGAYTRDFEAMEDKLDEVELILANATVTGEDLEELETLVESLRANLSAASGNLDNIDNSLDNTTQRIALANLALADLQNKVDDLKNSAQELQDNATELQEANVEGALKLTREAREKSSEAQRRVNDVQKTLSDSERQRRRTDNLLNLAALHFNQTQAKIPAALKELEQSLSDMEDQIPDINEQVCDDHGDPCSDLCGGAGCGKCGGLSCDEGAVTKADNALDLAKEADTHLNKKAAEVEELFRGVVQAKQATDEAHDLAKMAYDTAVMANNQSEGAKDNIENMMKEIAECLESPGAKPSEIRILSQDVLDKAISLKPEQITDLARRINETIASLTDIETILEETADDLALANELKERADRAKDDAEGILGTAQRVLDALDKAQEAQDRAEEAIKKANDDIAAAERDLTQITSETADAQHKANLSVADVENLKDKLKDLQKKFIKNERDVKHAHREAELAKVLAERAKDSADNLEIKYNEASSALDAKAAETSLIKDRAVKLQERATKLSANAHGKLTELKEMQLEYEANEYKLQDLSDELMELNDRMTDYLKDISDRAEEYRTCQT